MSTTLPTLPPPAPPEPPRQDQPAGGGARARGALCVLGLALLAGGGTLVVFSLLPFEAAKKLADLGAPDGNFEELTAEVFTELRSSWRLVGAVYAGLGALLALFAVTGLLTGYLRALGTDLRALARQWREECAAGWRRTGALHLVVLLAILAVALGLRVAYMSRPIRLDESTTFLLLARRPLLSIISDYSTVNNHMLHTVLLHYSLMLFGTDLWAIRLPCAAAGWLMVPAGYLCGRVYFGRNAALLAAGLIAAMPVLVDYSVNARGYSLFGLLFVLACTVALRLRDDPRLGTSFLLGVIVALGFFTQPSMVYPFALLLWWLVFAYALSKGARPAPPAAYAGQLVHAVAVAGLLTFAIYTLALMRTGLDSFLNNKTVAFTSTPTPDAFVAKLTAIGAALGDYFLHDVPPVIQAVLVAGFLTCLAHYRGARPHPAAMVAALVLATVPLFYLQKKVPYLRVWLYLVPLLLVMAGAGIALVIERLVARTERGASTAMAALALVLCLGNAISVVRTEHIHPATSQAEVFRNAPEVAQFLRENERPGDGIVLHPYDQRMMSYYLPGYQLPRQWQEPGPATSRLLVVINKEGVWTDASRIPTILAEANLDEATLSGLSGARPQLLRRFSHAEVYEVAAGE